MSGLSLHEDSVSSGFEPETPTSFYTQRTHAEGSQDESYDSLFGDDSGLGSVRTNNASNEQDETPLIEDLSNCSYNPSGTSDLFTVFLIVNAALGAGLLNFPKAFDEAGGITVAILVQLALLLFIVVALNMLAYSSDRNPSSPANTIEDVMGQSIGRSARIFTSLCVVVYCFGTTVTFLIMIGDQFDRIFESLVGENWCNTWYMNRDFTICAAAVVAILPFCFSKKIDFLRIPSLFGVLAILYTTGLITYEYFSGNFPPPKKIKHYPEVWTDLFFVVPVICFGYQCHVSVIPIYSCMKNRNLKHFAGVSCTAIFICAFAYSFSASCGYLTFGSIVNPDILLDYPADRPEVMFGVVAMAVKTVFTYPILLFCGREAFRSAIKDAKISLGYPVDQESQSILQRIIIVMIWFCLSLVCAIFIPDIGKVIMFLGCLAAFFIFFFPGSSLIANVVKTDPSLLRGKTKLYMLLGSSFLVVGAFILGVVFTQDVQAVIKTPTSGYLKEYFGMAEMSCKL